MTYNGEDYIAWLREYRKKQKKLKEYRESAKGRAEINKLNSERAYTFKSIDPTYEERNK